MSTTFPETDNALASLPDGPRRILFPDDIPFPLVMEQQAPNGEWIKIISLERENIELLLSKAIHLTVPRTKEMQPLLD